MAWTLINQDSRRQRPETFSTLMSAETFLADHFGDKARLVNFDEKQQQVFYELHQETVLC